MPKANREPKDVFRKPMSLLGLYEINGTGRVIRNVKSKKVIRQIKSSTTGYWMFHCKIKGVQHAVPVHSLVAECWLGERPEGWDVDHIDGDRDNNLYTNLRYVSHQDNCNNHPNGCTRLMTPVKWNGVRYQSLRDAARNISEITDVPLDTVRGYLRQRRRYILGAETEYYEPYVGKTQSKFL